MNFIAGHWLEYLNEEEAFWVVCSIIETIFPINYYSMMIGTMVDQRILKKMVKVIFPDIINHLKKLDMQLHPITIQWFISLFSYSFQSDVLDFIWDNFFLKGFSVLFKVSLSIFWFHQKAILSQKTASNIL